MRTLSRIAAISMLLLGLGVVKPVVARAQQSDSTQAMMGAYVDLMSPMMGKLVAASVSAVLDVLDKPATTEKLATFTRNYYDALVSKGFTKEEAMRIVLAVGVPMPGSK